MKKDNFFDESQEQSLVKSEIVVKYFWAWAKVIIPSQKLRSNKIAYIDLFAGPGRYKDGTKSTPLLILERAIQDSDMRDMLVTIFNDKNSDNTKTLSKAIESIPNVELLKNYPKVYNEEVGTEIVKMFKQMQAIPTLFFVDPWGYKGLSLGLIDSVLKNWGCDCIIFFNYNRINMGLHNIAVRDHMYALFGKKRVNDLVPKLEIMTPDQRELTIVEFLAEAINELGGKYILPFCFRNAKGNRTSHHLIFASKNIKGYEIMKEIMAKESSCIQGVPCFEYNPARRSQPLLFELSRPLDDLEDMLLEQFAGRQITMIEIYNSHHVGRRYVKSNYKTILTKMEAKGIIATQPPKEKRKQRNGEPTFGDNVIVIFPNKGN